MKPRKQFATQSQQHIKAERKSKEDYLITGRLCLGPLSCPSLPCYIQPSAGRGYKCHHESPCHQEASSRQRCQDHVSQAGMRWPHSHRALPSSRAALRNQLAEATTYFAGVQRDPHFFWYSWLQDVNSQPEMNGSKSTDTNGKARTFPQQPQRPGTQLRNVSSFLAKKNTDRMEIVGSFCLNEKEKKILFIFNIFFFMLCHAAKNVKLLEPGHFKVLVAKTNGSKGCFSAFKNRSLTRKNENCHCRSFHIIYFARSNVLMKKW